MRAWPSIGRMRWGWFLAAVAVLLVLPLFLDTHTPTVLLIWALFALSLGLMWGYAGLLSFGHSAYFGLGAYVYAVAVTNIGESTAPLLLAILVPAAAAAVIGAMMFYGRISDVYMGVITLVVTLILFKFMNATAGDAYRIGSARLGGFNGIPAFPILNVPGDPSTQIYGLPFYYLVVVVLLLCY
ncbi:MAG TPA: branched-chain amino acid ABC transporter permease, partial [Burkholderiales bacterium]|nr:branched-chain amino acid ABC transporter permease [Burkholderiales bacterium]